MSFIRAQASQAHVSSNSLKRHALCDIVLGYERKLIWTHYKE